MDFPFSVPSKRPHAARGRFSVQRSIKTASRGGGFSVQRSIKMTSRGGGFSVQRSIKTASRSPVGYSDDDSVGPSKEMVLDAFLDPPAKKKLNKYNARISINEIRI